MAVKFIRLDSGEIPNKEKLLHRFEREGRFLARLSHPNIVSILDVGEYQGLPFLVMEYVSGKTLKEVIREHKGPFSYEEAAHILAPIARALDYAHKNHILHRDVKPSNILFSQNGEAMLTDFGVAKLLELDETLDLTGTGVGIGTPEYMAPEQASNQDVDARADIYSLGVIFYELVTGRKPFEADTPLAVAVKHVNDPLPKPSLFVPDLPGEVESILFKALAKDPAERFTSMVDFSDLLEAMAGGELPRDNQFSQKEKPEKQTSASSPKPDKPKRKLLPIVLAAVVLIGVVVLSFVFFPTPNQANSSPTQPEVAALAETQTPQNLVETVSTATSTLSPTPEPSFTPTQTATASPTPLPQPITVDNIDQISWIEDLEMGKSIGYFDPIYSPNGSLIAAVGYTGLYIFDAETMDEKLHFADGISFNQVSFSPDSRFLVSASQDHLVQVWAVENGELILTISGYSENIFQVMFSPDGKIIASAGADKSIRLWSVSEQSLIKTFEGHTSEVESIAFSPDGHILASGSADMTVRLWDIDTGKNIITFTGHTSDIECVIFSPDGTLLATAEKEKIFLWNIEDGFLYRTFKSYSSSIAPDNFSFNLTFSPDGEILAGSPGGYMQMFKISNGAELPYIETLNNIYPISQVFFHPLGEILLIGSMDGNMYIYDMKDQEIIQVVKGFLLSNLIMSRDNTFIVLASFQGNIEVWDFTNQKHLYTIEGEHENNIYFSISPNSKYLATTDDNSSEVENPVINLRNLIDGDIIYQFQGQKKAISGLVFSPDNKLLASASIDEKENLIYFWDLQSGNLSNSIRRNNFNSNDIISNLQYTADGSKIAAIFGGIKFWNPINGDVETKSINGYLIKISPTGENILSVDNVDSDLVQYWNINNENLIFSISGFMRYSIYELLDTLYNSLADRKFKFDPIFAYENPINFSHNGQIIVFMSEQEGTLFWNANNGEIIHEIDEKICTIFTPDGRYVICNPGKNSTFGLYGIKE